METVSDMIAGFLAGLTPGTRAQYRSVVSRWLRWCADNADINAAKNILDRAIHTTGMDDAEGVEEHASRETCVSREGSVETPTPATHVGRLSE